MRESNYECISRVWIFEQKGSFDEKMNRVSNKTVPVCKVCGQEFKRNSNLKNHESNVHGTLGVRKCTCCDITHRQINNFLVHFKNCHLKKCNKKECNMKELCNVCTINIEKVKQIWNSSKTVQRLTTTVCMEDS